MQGRLWRAPHQVRHWRQPPRGPLHANRSGAGGSWTLWHWGISIHIYQVFCIPFFANIPVLFGSIQFGVFQTWTSTISLFQQARTPRSSKFHQRRHWRRWRCFFKYIDINYLIFLLIQGETLLFKAESHFQIFPWHRNCSLI